MIVVADTSPLNYLILLGRIDVLEVLYGRILIPHAVHDEMLSPKAPESVRAWAISPPEWLNTVSPSVTSVTPLPRLDRGETEAIALAGELSADWLLIDEAAGRDEAGRQGIQTIGTLGVLREAHRSGLLDLRESVEEIVRLGFRVSPSLLQRLLDSI
jgi:predicted nucleic acid-binding protein